MSHWTKSKRFEHDGEQKVARFELDNADLDLLAAFYQEATEPEEEPLLTAGDLIRLSRIFAMFHDAADWMEQGR